MVKEKVEDNGEKAKSSEPEKSEELTDKLDYRISEDFGAGYNPDDKRILGAIKYLEDRLLPFIRDNPSIFKNSGFLEIKGYGSDLKGKNIASHRSSPLEEQLEDRLDRHRHKRPRHST